MNFSQALGYLKEGHKVARRGWNGKGMFLYLVKEQKVNYENLRTEAAVALDADNPMNRGKRVIINSHIDMKAADGSIVVGWVASQTDMLANDWDLVR